MSYWIGYQTGSGKKSDFMSTTLSRDVSELIHSSVPGSLQSNENKVRKERIKVTASNINNIMIIIFPALNGIFYGIYFHLILQ